MEPTLQIPDSQAVARRRGQAFQRLPPDQRFRELCDTIETGMILIRDSPHREAIDRLYREREAEWRRIQTELFRQYLSAHPDWTPEVS